MGGGGKGGTTTQSVTIPPEVLARYNAVNARAEGLADTPFKPYSNDPNAFVAPLTPTQQAGITNTNKAAGMAQPYYGAATGMTMAGSQSVGQLTPEQINKYQNPYTQAVADTTFNNLRQQQSQEMQGATGNAIRAGAFGGDRSGLVAANLARQQQQGTAQAMAPIYQQGYQSAVQTAQGQQAVTAADLARLQQGGQQIAGLGSGAQGAALQGAQAQLAAGQTQQQTDQAGKAALYNQFLQEQGYPFQIAQFLANIAMGTGALSGSTTTTQAPGGFFSDERLKENVKKIGETNDGQPIYKYNYKGEPRTQIGLIAQDVEKSHPEAVGHQQGYKTVDYDRATENSEGGAVHQFNAREGFDLGGSAAFDPNMVKELLRRQVEMYQQQGAPGGGKTPGAAGYMPAPTALPANIGLARPAAPPQQQASGMAQAVNTARGITEGLGMAEGAKNKLFGGTDAKGNKVEGWFSGDSAKEGVDKNATLTDKQKADAEEARRKGIKTTEVDKAHGGLITGPRMGYAMGGLPYGDEEAAKKGYMGQLSYDMPSPAALKGQQDAMRAGKLPDAPQSGLGEAVGAASKLYGGTKMASAAYDKASSMLSGATPAGELASKYPAAPAGTPMPMARPEGLGLTAPATETAAAAAPVTEAVTAAAPVTEGLAAAAPVAEGLAAAAPVAEGLAAAAPIAEGIAAAAPVAEAGVAAAEALPLLFSFFSDERLKENIKKVGETNDGQNIYKYNFKGDPRTQIGLLAQEVAHDHPEAVGKKDGYLTVDYDKATSGREHHAGNEGNVVGESATPVFDELKRMREKDEAAAAAPVQSPAAPVDTIPAKSNIFEGLNPKSRAVVNNNPGNIIDSSFAKSQPGYLGSDGRFAKFESPEHGETAMHNLLSNYQKRGLNTPASIIGRWAPPSENDTSSYVAQVAKKLGVGPNDPIDVSDPNVRNVLSKTIALVEAGPATSGNKNSPQLSAYAPQEGLPSVAKDAFKGVREVPAAVEGGLGAAKKSLSDAGNFYSRNREHIIPAIAGIGSMLASNKANLGQALGEGLVGYSTSAADMMKRAADVENIRMGTESTRQSVVNARFTVDANGVGRVTYDKPGVGLVTLYESEYRGMSPEERQRLNLDPAVKQQMDEHVASKGAKAPPAGGLVPPATGTTTTAEPNTGLVPSGTAKPAATPFDVSDEDRSAAIKEAQKYVTNPRNAATVKDVFTPQQDIAEKARQQERILTEFGAALSALPREKSLLVVGATSDAAIKVAKLLNTVVPMGGGKEVVNPADVTNAENVRKTIENLKRNAQGNATALGIYQALEESLPSAGQTSGGSAKNFSQILVNNRREIDKDNYFRQWKQAAEGNNQYTEVATRTGTGLDERFNKKTAAEYEKERQALERMYTEYVPGSTSKSGRPMTYYEYLSHYASKLSPEEQEVVAKKFGAQNILRYFPPSGQ